MSASRILPASEYGRLPEEQAVFLDTMHHRDAAVVVVEDGSRIVARMSVLRVPHWESFWMAPEYSGNAGVTRALLRGATAQAQSWAKFWFYANADHDATLETLKRLGGQFMPMHTLLMPFRRLEMEESCLPQ